MQIYTMAVDVKLPESGGPQILEVMPGHHGGHKGYDRLYSKEHDGLAHVMEHRHIIPHLYEILDERLPLAVIKGWRDSVYELGNRFGFEAVEAGQGMIYPMRREVGVASLYRFNRSEFHHLRLRSQFPVINLDANFLQMTENKAALGCFIEDHPAFADDFVPTRVCPLRYDEGMAQGIIETLGTHDYYVLKPADEAQGNGVRIVARENLDTTLKNLLQKKRRYKAEKWGRDFWESDTNPVFVAQPYIASKAVICEEDSKLYDGTMRMFMTLWRENPDEAFQIKIHDGYWKLPHKALSGDKIEASARISHSPYRHESLTMTKYWLRERFNLSSRAMKSAKVSAEDKAAVSDRLTAFMPAFLGAMLSRSLYQRTCDYLMDERLERQGTGVTLACHPEYYPGSEEQDIPASARSYPADILECLTELQAQNNTPVRAFLNHALRYKEHKRLPEPVLLGLPNEFLLDFVAGYIQMRK